MKKESIPIVGFLFIFFLAVWIYIWIPNFKGVEIKGLGSFKNPSNCELEGPCDNQPFHATSELSLKTRLKVKLYKLLGKTLYTKVELTREKDRDLPSTLPMTFLWNWRDSSGETLRTETQVFNSSLLLSGKPYTLWSEIPDGAVGYDLYVAFR